MDAITLLKHDHKTVEALFKRFEKAGDNASKEKKQIVAQIIRELSIHAAIEEQVFYPAVRKGLKSAEDDVLEALEEHHIVKWLLSELDGMSPKEERYDAKVTVLIENVRHHVKEEEEDLFPKVQKKLGKQILEALGVSLDAAKKTVPTHPHPSAPDTPPGNVLVGLPTALVDKTIDKAKDFVRGVAKRAQSKKPSLEAAKQKTAAIARGRAQSASTHSSSRAARA